MKRLQYALLAGGTLVALTATGCSSKASQAAGQPPASSAASTGATGTAPSAATSISATTGGSQASSASSGGSSASSSASSKPSAPSSSKSSSAAGGTVADCDNAKLNASIEARTSGQKPSVYIIAVKNTGAACNLQYLPYVWITPGPNGGPEQTRPLIPSGLGGGPNIIAPDESQYAAIDLNPSGAADAVDGYTYLAVTANPTPNTSGKDVQDLKLPAPVKVAKAKLGLYMKSPAESLDSAEKADTPEQ
ncbi:MAG: hypothetical protein HOW97_19020 [Catenulispora sp.]|nr:hypothetical protein [Catenulispora sp.]